MTILFWLTFSVIAVYTLVYLVYCGAILFSSPPQRHSQFPKAAILIAARNEEANILACLQSVTQLTYPSDQLEIWIGDDHSEDATGQIVKDFIAGKPWMHYVRIETELPGLRGKQNVLAQLALLSRAEVFLVTDADIQVKPEWATRLVQTLNEEVIMVSGSTVVDGNSFFARMQSLDWLMGIGAASSHARLGIPITAVGNNMAFSAAAYRAAGGYESIAFSITEDYKLFQEMVEKRRGGYVHLLEPETLNISQPIFTLKGWLHQRRRWFRGGSEIPLYNGLFLLFNGTVIPVLIVSLFFIPTCHWLIFLAIKSGMDLLFLSLMAGRLGKLKWMLWFPVYEIYYWIAAVVTPLNFLIPLKVNWKGRKY